MNIKKLENLLRDSAYDDRKVLNSEDLIKTAKQMGYSYDDLSRICGISKTMISHWGNPGKPEKPTFKQLKPMFDECGRGRFNYELEALSPAAIEYLKIHQNSSFFLVICAILSLYFFTVYTPCAQNWDECRKLPWYKIGSYEMMKSTQIIEELREFKCAYNED